MSLKQLASTGMERLKRQEMIYFSLLAVLIGVLAGYAALLLRFSIEWVAHFWTGDFAWDKTIETLPWYMYILAPTLGGLLIGSINKKLLPGGELRGVAGVLADMVQHNARINPKQMGTETIGGAISIGSGASLGREGPTVALGAVIASSLGNWLGLTEQQMRTMVGCGVASAIAASFNTPIAGVLFALEVILADYAMATFSPIVISSVIATVITRSVLGNFPAFLIPEYHLVSAWEIVAYAIIGIFCGLIAAIFVRSMAPTRIFFMRLIPDSRFRPAVAGLILGLMGLCVPYIMSIGYGTLGSILLEQVKPVLLGTTLPLTAFLAIVLFGKLVAAVISFSADFPGGLLGPSLFLGAAAGALCGGVVHDISPAFTESYGAYALVACGALTAAALQAPITIILMVFELSADYHIMLPMMAASIIATLVKRAFGSESVFTEVLEERGIETSWGLEQSWMRSIRVKDIPWRPMPSVSAHTRLEEVKRVYVSSGKGCVQVVDDEGLMIGIITFTDLQPWMLDPAMDHVALAIEVVNRKVRTIAEDGSLLEAIRILDREAFEQMPVVSRNNPRKVLGILSRNAVFSTYHKLIVKHGKQADG
ncbi:MAG TPA: chloride channel protein [Mariprofundaceae bacterium]|nr:chloride channel protein [Mariprofundaceae bacterium]